MHVTILIIKLMFLVKVHVFDFTQTSCIIYAVMDYSHTILEEKNKNILDIDINHKSNMQY